jgi:hypothetical protein
MNRPSMTSLFVSVFWFEEPDSIEQCVAKFSLTAPRGAVPGRNVANKRRGVVSLM